MSDEDAGAEGRAPRGLRTRLAVTLALALLPIGLIAVYQATQINDEIERRREATILALTADAAGSEARTIAAAEGAVNALKAHIDDDGISPYDCSLPFKTFIEFNAQYSFAAFVGRDGLLACASAQVGRDVSSTEAFMAMSQDPRNRVVVNRAAPISGTSIIAVLSPYFVDGTYQGYVTISIPHNRIDDDFAEVTTEHPLDLVVFNADGEVLSSESGLENVEARLPKNRPLESLAEGVQLSFTGLSNNGMQRTFAVTAIIPGRVYALGSWPVDALSLSVLPAWTFPVFMLLTGLVVAWFATNSFVIRHIAALQRNMEEFARSRRLAKAEDDWSQPSEIRSMNRTWQEIAHHLMMDEAELEGALKEKNVLLKEVHHRVKNNLQLIASIVSMKLRRQTNPDARNVLKEVQMRVMSIAAVHRALYLSSDEGRVSARDLLSTVINTTIDAGAIPASDLVITRHYDPLVLYPDQAVPLSLFASEAVTNALKYLGRRTDGSTSLDIRLEAEGADHAVFSVVNSVGTPILPPDQVRGTGLGNSLLEAFAQQMRGTATIERGETEYSARVAFAVLPFDDEAQDGSIEDPDEG